MLFIATLIDRGQQFFKLIILFLLPELNSLASAQAITISSDNSDSVSVIMLTVAADSLKTINYRRSLALAKSSLSLARETQSP